MATGGDARYRVDRRARSTCTTVWDVIGGTAPLGVDIMVYDGTGRHPAAQVRRWRLGRAGSSRSYSIDDQLAQELTYAERIIWKRRVYELGVARCTFDHEIEKVERRGNRSARDVPQSGRQRRLWSASADQIIVEHGTLPADELYRALRATPPTTASPTSMRCCASPEQPCTLEPGGAFELHRVGDAVASRNMQAAVLDSMRLCRVL